MKILYLMIVGLALVPLVSAFTIDSYYTGNYEDWNLTCYDSVSCDWFQTGEDEFGKYWYINTTASTPSLNSKLLSKEISNVRYWDEYGYIVRFFYNTTSLLGTKFPPSFSAVSYDSVPITLLGNNGYVTMSKTTNYRIKVLSGTIYDDSSPFIGCVDLLVYVPTGITDTSYTYKRILTDCNEEISKNSDDYDFVYSTNNNFMYPEQKEFIDYGKLGLGFYNLFVGLSVDEDMMKVYDITTFQIKKKSSLSIQENGYLELQNEGKLFIKSPFGFLSFLDDGVWLLWLFFPASIYFYVLLLYKKKKLMGDKK